jgi:hypothetical protein
MNKSFSASRSRYGIELETMRLLADTARALRNKVVVDSDSSFSFSAIEKSLFNFGSACGFSGAKWAEKVESSPKQ